MSGGGAVANRSISWPVLHADRSASSAPHPHTPALPPDCKQAKDAISKLSLPEGKVGVVELDNKSDGSDVQVGGHADVLSWPASYVTLI